MGVKYLTHHHEKINARIPFTIDKNKLSDRAKEYAQIGTGSLKSIGIDGSVFLHSYTSNDEDIYNNAKIVCDRILGIVERIMAFFQIFNKEKNDNKNNDSIILHIVIDSKPPLPKNRKEIGKKDAYTSLSIDDKNILHKEILQTIESRVDRGNEVLKELSSITDSNNTSEAEGSEKNDSQISASFNRDVCYAAMSEDEKTTLHENILNQIQKYLYNRPYIKLLSNINEKDRKEGEIKLFSLCKEINEKYDYDPSIRNVIVSSDSDVVAMMNFHVDTSLVIVSNINGKLYILNHALLRSALDMTEDELITYTLLHYVFFGSDYNLGLVSSPTESKQKVIYQSVKNKINDINDIGKDFVRKRKREDDEITKDCKNDANEFLTQFKTELIFEAICSALYYINLGDERYLAELSPLLYRNEKSKRYIPFIQF